MSTKTIVLNYFAALCEESESLKKALGDDLVSNSGQIDWEI